MLNEKDLKRIEERIKEFFKKADQEIELEMSFNEEEKNVLEINICKMCIRDRPNCSSSLFILTVFLEAVFLVGEMV